MAANAPSLLAIRGELVVIGYEPDGDTMRFEPDAPELVAQLRDHDRVVHPESISLRFEGIDAPETHYASGAGVVSQPLAAEARDQVLAAAGFTRIQRAGEQVTSARPRRVPACVLSTHADLYGRVVAFVLAGKAAGDLPADGRWTPVDAAMIGRTLNASQLRGGAAYLTLYTSCAPLHRRALHDLAAAARRERKGVWAVDATRSFTLRDQGSIGPGGRLVLPKLFRRCTDFLHTRRPGQTLPEWMRANTTGPHSEDDLVVVGGRVRVPFSTLIDQRRDTIVLQPDQLDLVFVDQR